MKVFSQKDVEEKLEWFVDQFRLGAVFIYPTDTIYGVGCDATNGKAVRRIRELKKRESKPFSVIVPSFGWIEENCVVSDSARSYLKKLPGPYTFILPLKGEPVCVEVTSSRSLGVRIPKHWIAKLVEAFKGPIVTTSVNVQGLHHCGSFFEFEKFDVDFVIYEGEKLGSPSTVVDLTKEATVLR